MKSKLENFDLSEITSSIKQLGRKKTSVLYNVSMSSVDRYCTKYGICVHEGSIKRGNPNQRNNTIDDSELKDMCFKHYLIGLISSDGHVSNNNVKIYQKNAEYLKGIKQKLKSKSGEHIHKKQGGVYEAVIYSKLLQQECKKYMESDKRYSLKPYNCADKWESDYVRGLFDGDGCIHYVYRSGTLVNASMTICTGSPFMRDYLTGYFTRKGISFNVNEQISVNKYWVIGPSRADDIILFIDELYKDPSAYKLQSKYIKCVKYLKLREIDKMMT